ncbi:hypothetical protein Tco_1017270 [Tanacetum coccineum]|uniref:Uncharacterized protein n=1 Tax=Tanacetum coccineum TaxID=301880 RepID=A0ABQ5FS85_9ASTR
MAAPIISISSDSFEESVGSHAPRVILFSTIPTIIPVIPKVPIAPVDPIVASGVGVVSVISPTRMLDLVDYSSSSDSDPSEDSLRVALGLPLVSPFLCTNDSKADNESKPAEREDPLRGYESFHHHLRFHLHLLFPTTMIRRLSSSGCLSFDPWLRAIFYLSDYPFRQTPTNGPFSPSDSTSDISSGSLSNSSSVQSHSIVMLLYVGGSAPFGSTLYPHLRKLEVIPRSFSERGSHLGDSNLPSLLLDHLVKRIVEIPYSSRGCREEASRVWGSADTREGDDGKINVQSLEASAGGMMEIDVNPLVTGGISEPNRGDDPDLEGTLYDIAYYMSEVPLDRITKFETAQRQLVAGQLVASRERSSLADRVRSLGRENLRVRALFCIERDRVDSLRCHMALSQEEIRQICRDRDDTRRRLKKLESLVERRLGFRR